MEDCRNDAAFAGDDLFGTMTKAFDAEWQAMEAEGIARPFLSARLRGKNLLCIPFQSRLRMANRGLSSSRTATIAPHLDLEWTG